MDKKINPFGQANWVRETRQSIEESKRQEAENRAAYIESQQGQITEQKQAWVISEAKLNQLRNEQARVTNPWGYQRLQGEIQREEAKLNGLYFGLLSACSNKISAHLSVLKQLG